MSLNRKDAEYAEFGKEVCFDMSCKGICSRYKAPKPPSHVGSRYGIGQKRCRICGLFIRWNGIWCPCCHYRLRVKPRNPKSKHRLTFAVEERR